MKSEANKRRVERVYEVGEVVPKTLTIHLLVFSCAVCQAYTGIRSSSLAHIELLLRLEKLLTN
jgi:hypothetical protein